MCRGHEEHLLTADTDAGDVVVPEMQAGVAAETAHAEAGHVSKIRNTAKSCCCTMYTLNDESGHFCVQYLCYRLQRIAVSESRRDEFDICAVKLVVYNVYTLHAAAVCRCARSLRRTFCFVSRLDVDSCRKQV